MALGISPRKVVIIPLGEYKADYYLTLMYHAFANLGWHTGYFDRDGIIAYTNISWESYAEEISVRIVGNNAVIKSECVGYQFFFYDYGKNKKNLDQLLNEIPYVEYHLEPSLDETTQDLIDSIPENQFIQIDDPPMGAKETLHSFLAIFTPRKQYFFTPLLVLLNIVVFIITMAMLVVLSAILYKHGGDDTSLENVYLSLGFSGRPQVLGGQVWRLVTNTFLHFSFWHLAGNMIVLIYIGSMLECKLGKWNYLLLYLFTGICASVTSVMWNAHKIAGGASGAIFGLFGIMLALLSTGFYERNARRALFISTALFVGLNIIPVGEHIDHAAHTGGLVSGYLLGWLAYLGLKYKKRSLATVVSLAITLLFAGMCLWLAPVYNFKRLELLTEQNRLLTDSLNDDFYGSKNIELNHADHLMLIERRLRPRLLALKDIAQKLTKVSLPHKQEQIAGIRSKIVLQEVVMFDLLYKEMREPGQIKYRYAIEDATDRINQLRREWGKLDDGGGYE